MDSIEYRTKQMRNKGCILLENFTGLREINQY